MCFLFLSSFVMYFSAEKTTEHMWQKDVKDMETSTCHPTHIEQSRYFSPL